MIKVSERLRQAEDFLNSLYAPMLADEFEYPDENFCLCSCTGWNKDEKPKAKNFKTLGYFQKIDDVLKEIEKNLDRDLWLQIATGNGKSRNKIDTKYAHTLVIEIDNKNLKDPEKIEKLCFKIDELQPGIIVGSGNGNHLYFLLDEPFRLTEQTLDKFELYGSRLRMIMEQTIKPYMKDKAKLDSIQDASRILRIPGTRNNKDSRNPKPVSLLHQNTEQRYSFDEICQTIDKLCDKLRIQTVEHHTGSIAKLNGSDIQLTAGLKLSEELFKKVAASNKNFEIAFNGKMAFDSPSERDQALSNFCRMSGLSSQETLSCLIQCRENLSNDTHLDNPQKYIKTIEKSFHDLQPWKAHGGASKTTLDLKFVLECFNNSEDGDSKMFEVLSDDNNKYDPDLKEWLFWNDYQWEQNDFKHMFIVSKVAAEYGQLKVYYKDKIDKADDKDNIKFYKKKLGKLFKRIDDLKTIRKKETVVKNALTLQNCIQRDVWDQNRGKLPFKNGYYDLDKDQFINDPDRLFFNKKAIQFDYDPAAGCPNFLKPIHDNFNHHESMKIYLQMLLGYAAYGAPKENILVFFYGPSGQNGKGSILNAAHKAMGDYSHILKPNVIMENKFQKQAGANSPELVALPGKRFVIVSETGKGRIDIPTACNFSGQDPIGYIGKWGKKERFFIPDFNLFINTNNRPKADKIDDAYWKRVHIIKFEIEYLDAAAYKNLEEKKQLKWYHRRRDADMISKISTELPGIANFLIEGYRLYKKHGLKQPEWITDQKDIYRNLGDGLEKFVNAGHVEFEEHALASTKEVFDLYTIYTKDHFISEPLETQRRFTQEFCKRFAGQLGSEDGKNIKTARPNCGYGEQAGKPLRCFVDLSLPG